MEDMSAEEIDAMLAQADVRNLDVVVQKTDGSIKKVALTKEKIKTESNMIKSYVVDSNPKIGYIALPGFYVDADNKNGLGCANDVAKEIIRLKAEGIQGLVFDVRYNGGGAMREAQDLSGLFINEGPLFSIKDQNKTPILMKDLNRGTLFEGPMVVLVNGQSASASEIFASTLQDYNRAVLVGSTTYGKATGQSTHPIGVALDDPEANSRTHFNSGGVSVTRLKIYRLTGKSNQQVGLSPDISMPDLFEKLHVGERHYANALSKDETSKKPLFNALPTLPLTKLRESAYTRQQGHPAFIKLKDLIVQTPILLSKEKVVPVSLTLESMYPLVQEYKSWIASMATLSQTTPKVFTIHATTVDTQMAKLDIRYDEVQKQVIDDLERDLFIQESCHILLDLIKFTAK
ncbi:MAG TPA: S41 family peptidase, partial [Cytophagales bacterium]|nr:S41 family peptidase [Cytophagales bacterium]